MSRRFLWPVAHSCEPRFGPPSSAQFRLFGAKPPRQDPIGPHHHQPQYQKHPRKSQRVLHHARIPQRIRIHEPVWIESCDCAADQRRCRVDRGIRHPPHRVLPSQPALLHKQQPPPHIQHRIHVVQPLARHSLCSHRVHVFTQQEVEHHPHHRDIHRHRRFTAHPAPTLWSPPQNIHRQYSRHQQVCRHGKVPEQHPKRIPPRPPLAKHRRRRDPHLQR